jgi:threonine dehydratase
LELNLFTKKAFIFQGSIALEFLEDVPNLDAILIPASKGGMTAGITIAAKAIKPNIKSNHHHYRHHHQ